MKLLWALKILMRASIYRHNKSAHSLYILTKYGWNPELNLQEVSLCVVYIYPLMRYAKMWFAVVTGYIMGALQLIFFNLYTQNFPGIIVYVKLWGIHTLSWAWLLTVEKICTYLYVCSYGDLAPLSCLFRAVESCSNKIYS